MAFKSLLRRRLPAALKRVGESVTLVPQAGTRVTTYGFLDRPFREVGLGAGVESKESSLLVVDTDATGLAHGDTVETIDDGNFRIVGIEPNSQGFTRLMLEPTT